MKATMGIDDKLFNALREAMDDENAEIQLSDEFREYESWDSLAHLSMVALLDEEFGIEIEGKAFQELVTVQDLINEVQERIEN
jgi:acyl carrier protein